MGLYIVFPTFVLYLHMFQKVQKHVAYVVSFILLFLLSFFLFLASGMGSGMGLAGKLSFSSLPVKDEGLPQIV